MSLKKTPNPCLPARLAARLGPLALAVALLCIHPAEVRAQQAPVTLRDSSGETSVVADRIQQIGGDSDLLLATGNVEITRGGSRLLADRVELNRNTGEAVAQGKVVFFDGQDRLVGERVDYNLNTGTGVVYKGAAQIPPYYRLSAERFDRLGESLYGVRQGVFTTCEGEVPDWSVHLGSGQADLDGIVFGRDASFWVKSVPVLPWVPFFAAALRRERQSGFLFPEFGQNSRKGYFARVPYYWAISDSQDLTVTLDTFTQRGMGLELDYRYVLSREAQGQVQAFGVNEAFLDSRTSKGIDENRGWIQIKHAWQITPSMSLKIDSNVTSDDDIYKTYADAAGERARQRAETNVFVTQRWESWNLVGRVYWYQDLTTPRPVELQRAPEIKLEGIRQAVPGVPGLLFETQASFVSFFREIGSEGVRGDVHPRFLYPVPVAGLFTMTPFLGGRLTYYNQRVVRSAISQGPDNGYPVTVEKTVDDDRVRQQVEAGVQLETRVSRRHLCPPARHRATRHLPGDSRHQSEGQSAMGARRRSDHPHRPGLRGADGHRRPGQGQRSHVQPGQPVQRAHGLGSQRGARALGARAPDPEPDLQFPGSRRALQGRRGRGPHPAQRASPLPGRCPVQCLRPRGPGRERRHQRHLP